LFNFIHLLLNILYLYTLIRNKRIMATKKAILTKDKIVSMYMDYTLEHNEKPKSVYQFAKLNGFPESEFYTFFGTLESLEKEIFALFFDNTISLLEKNEDYQSYDMKSKLLSFYFTFFELLTANRSYVMTSLKQHKNLMLNLMILSELRKKFKNYISEIITDDFRIQQEKLQKYQEKATTESFWFQFMLSMKFWMEDKSASFEKTDIYIEKSVKASFDLMNIAPINSIIDFGKFIFKEKIQSK
jgi:Tetracyclin repressor-like, C-terminal domain